MLRDKRVYGEITLTIKLDDTFNEHWNDNEIESYIKEHIYDYITQDDIDNAVIDIDYERTISRDEALADYYYESMKEGDYE